MGKIAIFGFGRIGRQLLRVALQEGLFTPVSISDIKDEASLAALFEVDTNYKRWHESVVGGAGRITIGGREILYLNSSQEVPDWKTLGVSLVIDCTGRAVVRSVAQVHLDRGADRVLVSGPSKTLDDCDAVLLKGINLDSFDPDKHKIISMASCTTNALAPVVKLVRENFGIKYGLFSTVHSYTNTQSLTDQPMKDRRDSWAAAENIIPSSSGAAKALKFIWNDLQITGKAYRIPTRTGSIAELNLITEKPVTVQQVNDLFRSAAGEGDLKGVLDVLEGEWASSRIVGDSHSSIIDLPLTQVQGEIVSIAAWYDNEWGYASRLAEVAAYLAAGH
jgi:glyceraldehyde 3-phosphate dehydrogenase